MTIERLKEIFAETQSKQKNCYAITIGNSYKEILHGELSIIREVADDHMKIFRTKNASIIEVKAHELDMFEYVY